MPAVTADTMTLPRIDAPEPGTRSRTVRTVTTAPRGFEGEGFPVRRAFAGVRQGRARSVRPHGPDGRGRVRRR